jgi:YggT family protein
MSKTAAPIPPENLPEDTMTEALESIVNALASLYFWIIVISVILSWLVAFNVINPYNQFVRTVQVFCYRATEPLLAPIRRFLPDLGGLDISPVILLIGVEAARILLINLLRGQLI